MLQNRPRRELCSYALGAAARRLLHKYVTDPYKQHGCAEGALHKARVRACVRTTTGLCKHMRVAHHGGARAGTALPPPLVRHASWHARPGGPCDGGVRC